MAFIRSTVLPVVSCDTSDCALASSSTRPSGFCAQAGSLLVDGLVKALLIELDAQAAGRHFGALFERFEIGLRGDLHLGQIGFDAHPVPTGGLQILGGADKGAGLVVHGFLQGIEVAAGFREQET